MNKRILVSIVALVILAAVGTAAFIYLRPTNAPPSHQPTQTPSSNQPSPTPSEQSPTPTQATYPVKVYFSKHPESDDDPSKVFPVDRTAPTIAVASYAISQLIAGPSASETAKGYFSNVQVRSEPSDCSDQDFTLTIKDTVATLRFCRTFDARGSVSDGQAQETIKASMLQFSTVKKVVILSKTGNCQFDMSGQNLCL